MRRVNVVAIRSDQDVLVESSRLDGHQVFVYGEEVDDFRTVDYEGLTALNISATQELAKRLARQQADVAALVVDKDAQIADLRERLAKQQSRIAELEGLAESLQDIRGQPAALRHGAESPQWRDAALRP